MKDNHTCDFLQLVKAAHASFRKVQQVRIVDISSHMTNINKCTSGN
jgi:hypothetical protein